MTLLLIVVYWQYSCLVEVDPGVPNFLHFGKPSGIPFVAPVVELCAGSGDSAAHYPLPANNDILLQFPYTKLTCVRILPLVNVLVLLGDELLAVILANVNTNLYLPTPENKLQLIGY